MRLRLVFKNIENVMPIDYRKHFIHFIKKSCSEYDSELFNEIYSGNKVKPFAFSIYFTDSIFKVESININENNSTLMNIAIDDAILSLKLSNAFLNQKNKIITSSGFSTKLISIELLKEERIKNNKIFIKFKSPLVIQQHEYNKDYFYSVKNEDFFRMAQIVIQSQLSNMGINVPLNSVELIPVKAKKTVVKFYEKSIECSFGDFILIGSPTILQHLYNSGIGSKRSSGFGLFDVIGGA